jgi:hypothetical protein
VGSYVKLTLSEISHDFSLLLLACEWLSARQHRCRMVYNHSLHRKVITFVCHKNQFERVKGVIVINTSYCKLTTDRETFI